MSVKGIFEAIGLWAVFFASLEWCLYFYYWFGYIFFIIYFAFLAAIPIAYIAIAVWGGKAYCGREVFLHIFVMSFLFAFAFLIAGWLFGPDQVFFGIFISPLIALLHIEIKAGIRKYGGQSDDYQFGF